MTFTTDHDTALRLAPNEIIKLGIAGHYLISRIILEPGRAIIECDPQNAQPDIADQLAVLSELYRTKPLTEEQMAAVRKEMRVRDPVPTAAHS